MSDKLDRGRNRRWAVRARAKYRFESQFSGGPIRVVAWLGLSAFAVAVLAGWALWIARGPRTDPDVNMPEAIWQSGTRLLDPGTFADDIGWQRRAITLLVTICGLIITSVLIGLTAAGFDSKMLDLRKGHGSVLESGHTLILGWSPRIFLLLNELVGANDNQRHATIVIMADEDAEWMYDQVRKRVAKSKRVLILCRTGHSSSAGDLHRVEAHQAKSIVILGPDGRSDALAVKSMLGLVSIDLDFNRTPVIVELNDVRHARDLAIQNHFVPVQGDEIVALVTAQSCRQAGLAEVLMRLLDFAGDEIYFHEFAQIAGLPFGQAQLRLKNSCLIGLRSGNGDIHLSPGVDHVIQGNDECIVIAPDDDTTVLGDFTSVRPLTPAVDRPVIGGPIDPERLLILNWSHLGKRVLEELDGYVPEGSRAVVVVDKKVPIDSVPSGPNLRNLVVTVEVVDDDLDWAMSLLDRDHFDHVLVLGYRDHLSDDEADARTLIAVVTLDRHFVGPRRPRIVSEVCDERSVDLMRTAGADDFVIKTSLSGLLLAQLSERVELMQVFRELFDAKGARVEMVSVSEYVDMNTDPLTVSFAELVATVALESGALIGYRSASEGVKLNPDKSEIVCLSSVDHLVVVRRAKSRAAPSVPVRASPGSDPS